MSFPENLKSRAEDFSIIAGLDLDQFTDVGIVEAIRVFDTFVKGLPQRFLEPQKFAKMMVSNVEFLYSLVEAVGSSLVSENVSLKDQLKDAHAMMDKARIETLCNLRDLSKSATTLKYLMDGDEEHSFSESDDEDLPYWKITIVLPDDKKITHILDHIEASQYFNHAQRVEEDPHPEYDGIDSFDQVPADDFDTQEDMSSNGFDDQEDDETM